MKFGRAHVDVTPAGTTAAGRDETRRAAIDGHEVVSYSYGSGEQVVFLFTGGPGQPARGDPGAGVTGACRVVNAIVLVTFAVMYLPMRVRIASFGHRD